MLHFELHDTTHNKRIHLGTIGDFINLVTADIAKHPILINSKARLDKELQFAFDRVIQKIRDEQ